MSQNTRSSAFTSAPIEGSPLGGVRCARGRSLPHAASDNVGQGEIQSAAGGQACVKSSFCEVAEKESVLVAKIKEGGAVVHALSGTCQHSCGRTF